MKKAFVRKKLNQWTFFDYVNAAFMLFLVFITLYPVWYVFCVSVSTNFTEQISFLPKGFSFDAYFKILETDKIPRAYLNSIIYTAVGTLCNVFMTTLLAYPLSRKTFVFRKPITILVVITMFFSGGLIPTYLLVNSLGLLNTMWSLILPALIGAFDLMILKSFFEGLPGELYEAAIIDGATEFKIMYKIFVPLAKPALASITLFYAMGHWNSYLIPAIYITTYNKYPLQVILRDMLMNDQTKVSDVLSDAKFTPEALKNATIFCSIFPLLVLYPYLQKYFIKGLTIGAVKG